MPAGESFSQFGGLVKTTFRFWSQIQLRREPSTTSEVFLLGSDWGSCGLFFGGRHRRAVLMLVLVLLLARSWGFAIAAGATPATGQSRRSGGQESKDQGQRGVAH